MQEDIRKLQETQSISKPKFETEELKKIKEKFESLQESFQKKMESLKFEVDKLSSEDKKFKQFMNSIASFEEEQVTEEEE